MKHKLHLLVIVITLSAFMSGCKENIDFNNIDKRAAINMGLGIPVGDITATLGDFLGNGQVSNLFVGDGNITLPNGKTIDYGLFYFRDTFNLSRPYHDVDLSQYLSNTTKNFNVLDKLDDLGMVDANNKVTGVGMPITLKFPLTLKLDGINKYVQDERLDSAKIKDAKFTSIIKTDNFDLDWAWIDKVDVVLGDAFRREAGDTVRVYTKGETGKDYNTAIDIDIDEFTICLMKDKNLNPAVDQDKYSDNTMDSCKFEILFTFTIPSGRQVQLNSSSAFNYYLGVQFINYYAIWGFFKPSNQMQDADTIFISKEWPKWEELKKAKLPLAEPCVDMMVTTTVAGRTIMHGDYMFVETSADISGVSQKQYATFDDHAATEEDARKRDVYFKTGEWLPLTSQIGDSATAHIIFDQDGERGRIDKLFALRPDILGYKFSVEFDKSVTPQIRITNNTRIRIDADVVLPCRFNQGIGLNYNDTVTGINLSSMSLDSLLADANILDTVNSSDLKLFIQAQNRIPLHIKGVFRFIDENGNTIMEPGQPTVPFRASTTDTLYIEPPTYAMSGSKYVLKEPGKSTFIISLDKAHTDLLVKAKALKFEAFLDDDPLNNAYQSLPNFKVELTKTDALTLQVGVTANVDAVLNFNNQ